MIPTKIMTPAAGGHSPVSLDGVLVVRHDYPFGISIPATLRVLIQCLAVVTHDRLAASLSSKKPRQRWFSLLAGEALPLIGDSPGLEGVGIEGRRAAGRSLDVNNPQSSVRFLPIGREKQRPSSTRLIEREWSTSSLSAPTREPQFS
jgi:hypothetical protein